MEILQTVFIIILIIIGIVIFIFLIAEVEFPPPTVQTPFKNGANIRIKSLANNKYLRVADCSSGGYTSCTLTDSEGWTGCRSTFQQIVADGDINDNNILWQLCQYTGDTQTPAGRDGLGLAVYVIQYVTTTTYMFYEKTDPNANQRVTLSNVNNTCANFNSNYTTNSTVLPDTFFYFAFELIENQTGDINILQSGVYKIRGGLNLNLPYYDVMVCTGTKNDLLYTECNSINNCILADQCPVYPFMIQSTELNNYDPISYGFTIEVVS